MRKLIALIALSAAMAGGATGAALFEKATVTIRTNIYCDHCKQCESCGPRIYHQLMELEGVRNVEIDVDAATITVTYNPEKTEPTTIKQALLDAGFDADDQQAPAEAVAKLDACCLKRCTD